MQEIPNFLMVDAGDPGVYRGAQPVTEAGWAWLRFIGVKRIVKLNTDAEGDDSACGIPDVLKCPITLSQQVLTEPDVNSLRTAIAFIAPGTFVHCGSADRTRHALLTGDSRTAGGQDRTGLVIALYRLKQGWTKDEARTEMIRNGFHPMLLGLELAWSELAWKPSRK